MAFLCNFGIHGWSHWREEPRSRWTENGPMITNEMTAQPVVMRRTCGLCGEIERKSVPIINN